MGVLHGTPALAWRARALHGAQWHGLVQHGKLGPHSLNSVASSSYSGEVVSGGRPWSNNDCSISVKLRQRQRAAVRY